MSRNKNARVITTVRERESSSGPEFSFGDLGDVAIYLAIARKRKAMKDRGRKRTDRALKQWAASHEPNGMIAQTTALAFNAARRAKRAHPDADKTQLAALVHMTLLQTLLRELVLELDPKGGRGRKQRGLINVAMGVGKMGVGNKSKRLSGRPPFVSAAEERSWLEKVYEAKAGRRFPTATLANLYKRFGPDLLKMLDDAIRDSEVAALDSIRSTFPGSSIAAIKQRIYRAKNTFTLDIPKGKRGGQFLRHLVADE